MSEAITIVVIAQVGTLVTLIIGQIWQHRQLRLNLHQQNRALTEQLRAQREASAAQLSNALEMSRAAWLRERHERVSTAALDAATQAASAFTRAMGELSAAAIAARDAECAARHLEAARRHREELRLAHSRLYMLVKEPAETLIDLRAYLQQFERMVLSEMDDFTGGVDTEAWRAKHRVYRAAEQEFYDRMRSFVHHASPTEFSDDTGGRTRIQVAMGEFPPDRPT